MHCFAPRLARRQERRAVWRFLQRRSMRSTSSLVNFPGPPSHHGQGAMQVPNAFKQAGSQQSGRKFAESARSFGSFVMRGSRT